MLKNIRTNKHVRGLFGAVMGAICALALYRAYDAGMDFVRAHVLDQRIDERHAENLREQALRGVVWRVRESVDDDMHR